MNMKEIGTTLLKSFLAAFIGYAIATGGNVLDFSGGEWKAAAGAGIAAALLVAYNWLNPTDTRYGVGSE